MSTIRRRGRSRRPIGFTLLELLVVVTIVILVSAVAIAAIVPALMHQQVGEAARLLQGALVGARDNAIRANAPRGIRLLPDPAFATNPSILASNRFVPIETAPDYTEGLVVVWPVPSPTPMNPTPPFVPALYPYQVPASGVGPPYFYPYYAPNLPGWNPTPGQVLMIEQAPFTGNLATPSAISPPTNWFWNIRIGDKIRINNSGRSYTVVGPMTINPLTTNPANLGNPELFVNVGQPGDTTNYLFRQYTDPTTGMPQATPERVEFLYLINGQDDNGDGYVDSGWDGLDNDFGTVSGTNPFIADDIFEWEIEAWLGTQLTRTLSLGSYWNYANGTVSTGTMPPPQSYAITRRPVPSQGAREVALPSGVVVDLTTWNAGLLGIGSGLPERSRLPVDPKSLFVDIMLDPSGQVVPTTEYSTPSSVGLGGAFYHFWIAERQDLHEVPEAWAAQPGGKPPAGASFLLPVPAEFTRGLSAANQPAVYLKGDRILVTLYGRTGQVVTNRLDSVNLAVPGDPSTNSFNAGNSNFPYIQAQLGVREAK